MPGGDGAVRAERSYATSEARGDGHEELPGVGGQGRRQGGANPSEARGGVWDEQPHIQGGWLHGRQKAKGAILRSRPGGVVVRRYASSK